MSGPEIILEYKGIFSFENIDPLLEKLKTLPAYLRIRKKLRKKLYSIFVECAENIDKHTVTESILVNDKILEPYIILYMQDEKYIIETGNVIRNKNMDGLRKRFEQINRLDMEGLKATYAEKINKEYISEAEGAGLGLITVALKAEGNIHHSFTPLNDRYSYFEMKITI
jgi:hypothetical protein